MIELLNNYRIKRQGSESAAKDLGYGFGQAFEVSYRSVDEVSTANLDSFGRSSELTIDKLKLQFLGGRVLFAKAFGDVIKLNPTSHEYSIGIHFPSDSQMSLPGSDVVLHEEPFVRGFIDGFSKSRALSNHQRSESPALAN